MRADPKRDRAAYPLARRLEFPALDTTALVAEDARSTFAPGVPTRVGVPRPVPVGGITPTSHGTWLAHPDGVHTWTLAIHSSGAKGLRLHFFPLSLPIGGVLVVRGADGQRTQQFSPKSLGTRTEAWTDTLEGETAYMEYQGPRLPAPVIRITGVEHIYRHSSLLGAAAPNVEAEVAALLSCQEDVNCHSVNEVAKDSVGRMLFTRPGVGTFACSGALLNDVDTNTFAGYFLTANHCLSTQAEVDSLSVRFLYETTSCNGSLGASVYMFGGTLLATSPNTDFTFLRLANDPSSGQGFAAWTTGVPGANGATVQGIHHPGGSHKRYSSGTTTTSQPICGGYPTSNYVYNDWSVGITEGGSSGSPLFNSSWEVIGQLFGVCYFSPPACNNPQDYNNVYGRFSVTFPSIQSFLNTITPDDPYEPNDASNQAGMLTIGSHSLKLVDFEDYFQYPPTCGLHAVTATATFNTADVDLDLFLYDGSGNLLDSSYGVGSSEMVYAVSSAGVYILRAFKHSGWGGSYDLTMAETLMGPDCNDNDTDDSCEISADRSLDCNHDGILDECQKLADCNGNDYFDVCDIGAGLSSDCNGNGSPDECEAVDCPAELVLFDVNSGGDLSSSNNYEITHSTAQHGGIGVVTGGPYTLSDGFWHSVTSLAPAAPDAVEPDPNAVNKNRFIGFVVPAPAANRGPGTLTALRVTLTTLNHPRFCCTSSAGISCSTTTCDTDSHCFAVPGGNQTCAHQAAAGVPDYSAMQGNIRYVNSFSFPAEGGALDCPDDGPPFNTSYKCATLGCEPEYRDWATDLATPGPNQPQVPGLIYITGDALVPSSTVEISHIAASCGAAATANTCTSASAPLAVGTARWGDLNGAGFSAPDGKSDVLDIPPIVNKLKTVSPIFSEPRLWLKQRDPVPHTDAITVIDLSDVVDAGPQAKPYPASRTIDSCPHD